MLCFQFKHNKALIKMGNLPPQRIKPSRPFLHCCLDFAGPFLVNETKFRNRKFVKGYVCVFVCYSTKVWHLEFASDLSTETFLNCLKRFVSHRGLPSSLYSDRAMNFIGADRHLKEIFDNIHKYFECSSGQEYLLSHKISWHFMPAHSPHFDGLHESTVKSFKTLFKKVTWNVSLSLQNMLTLFNKSQVESILNSRPLFPISNDPHDLEVHTPGHFFVGCKHTATPQSNVTSLKNTLLSQYTLLQTILQDFWRRWPREYLCTLQSRGKWNRSRANNIVPGSLILLRDELLLPQQLEVAPRS